MLACCCDRAQMRLIDDADDVRAALDGLAERPRGRLRINAPYTFAVGLIGPMLPAFVRAFPDIHVVLDIDNNVLNLHAIDLDLAVRVGSLVDSDLVAQKLTTVALWACASPAYLEERGVPQQPADLAHHRLVARVDEISHWGFRDADGTRVEVEVRPDLVIPEPAVMLTLAVAGAGISRLPDFIAREAIASGHLVRVLSDLQADCVDVHALYTSRRALPIKARVFIRALLDHLAMPGAEQSLRLEF